MRLWDALAVAFGLLVAARLLIDSLNGLSLQEFLSLEFQLRDYLSLAVLGMLWAGLFQAFSLYERSALANLIKSASAVAGANGIGMLFLAGIIAYSEAASLSAAFLALAWAIATALALAPRWLLAYQLSRVNGDDVKRRRFIVVGTGERARRVASSLANDKLLPREFLGFVDMPVSSPGENNRVDHFLALDDLPDFLRHSPVDDVIVCLPLKSCYDATVNVIGWCEEQGVTVHVCGDIFETRMTHSRVRYFANEKLITVATNDMHGAPAQLKRGMDFLLASMLIIVLSPVLLATTIAVMITSPGPAFFSQERVGLNKKVFRVHKFRTMVTDAEVKQGALEAVNEASGPAFKIQDDPRVTPIGRFLRKFSIDELPQLFNVVRGEMSLVGPRPLPLRDYSGFDKDWHRRRLSVPPGITGLWQVKDRNHQSFENWMRLDMQYIDQWSNWLDIKILVLTIPAVLRGSGS